MLRWLGVFLVLAALASPLLLFFNRTTFVFLGFGLAALALVVAGFVLVLRPQTPLEAAEGLQRKDFTGSVVLVGSLVALFGLAVLVWSVV